MYKNEYTNGMIALEFELNRDELFEAVRELPPGIAVIEALWDGDSNGWMVRLVAIEKIADDQFKEHYLATIGHFKGEIHDFNRAFRGETPPYPEGLFMQKIGQEVADYLGVPFHFPSPEKPALDEVPRWVDWQAGRISSIPINLIDAEKVIADFGGQTVAVVEAYWGYYHTWHPRLAVITVEASGQYKAHDIGRLYWDDHDRGKVIRGWHIPPRAPVEEAVRIGELLATAFQTTFYFESSDDPKRHIPRWIAAHGQDI